MNLSLMGQFWLMKSEPEVFSIQDLKNQGETLWEGVRNYQARNYMTTNMKLGDPVLFYHSNAQPPGVAGLAIVSGLAEPDPTQFDPKSEYFDPKSSRENPRWHCVRVRFQQQFPQVVALETLRLQTPLKKMILLQRGTRLSITPVTESEYQHICKMARG